MLHISFFSAKHIVKKQTDLLSLLEMRERNEAKTSRHFDIFDLQPFIFDKWRTTWVKHIEKEQEMQRKTNETHKHKHKHEQKQYRFIESNRNSPKSRNFNETLFSPNINKSRLESGPE